MNITQRMPRGEGASAPPRPTFVPGALMVRVREDTVEGLPDISLHRRRDLRSLRLPTTVDEPFRALRGRRLIRAVIPLFAKSTRGQPVRVAPASVAAAFMASVRESENEDLRGITMLQLSPSADLSTVEKDLRKTPGVVYAHQVPARWLLQRARRRATPPAAGADPLLNRQWNLRAIRWFQAKPLPDASAVSVGVLDTGIDADHPDLKFQAYFHQRASAKDIVGHGTHVAGIIGARSTNAVGISGLCGPAMYIWKIFGDEPARDGEYYVDEVMYQRALNAARNQNVQVINLSIGSEVYTQTEALLIQRLIANRCVVVAAMGNEYEEGNPVEYPANYEDVIAVGATNESNRRAPFSNTGNRIGLCAPGTNVLSTLPMTASSYRDADETEYAAWSGTSMAAPHVSAAAALLLAKRRDLAPKAVASKLQATATKLGKVKGRRRSRQYGAGLLNLEAALK